jgi:hypothetical protein
VAVDCWAGVPGAAASRDGLLHAVADIELPEESGGEETVLFPSGVIEQKGVEECDSRVLAAIGEVALIDSGGSPVRELMIVPLQAARRASPRRRPIS